MFTVSIPLMYQVKFGHTNNEGVFQNWGVVGDSTGEINKYTYIIISHGIILYPLLCHLSLRTFTQMCF